MALHRIAVNVMLLNDKDEILLIERLPGKSHAGQFNVPGGGLDAHEEAREGARRELLEEIGVHAREEDLELAGVITKPLPSDPKLKTLYIFFACRKWKGTPQNLEPEKHGKPTWHPLKSLPRRTSPLERLIIKNGFRPDMYVLEETAEYDKPKAKSKGKAQ